MDTDVLAVDGRALTVEQQEGDANRPGRVVLRPEYRHQPSDVVSRDGRGDTADGGGEQACRRGYRRHELPCAHVSSVARSPLRPVRVHRARATSTTGLRPLSPRGL